MNTYSAKAVANEFLDIAESEGSGISPMKLQKLVYLAHGWSLGIMDTPLISDKVQAWKYGPVIESLYHEFKHHGSNAIYGKATNLSLDKDTLGIKIEEPAISSSDNDAKRLITKVWEIYKKYSGSQLSNITHQDGTPWKVTYSGKCNVSIDNNVIKNHYKDLIESREIATAN